MIVRPVPNQRDAKRILRSGRRIYKFLLTKGPTKLVRTLTWFTLQRIKENSPVRTGSYRDGWDAVIMRGTQGMVGRVQHKWRRSRKGRARLGAIEFGARPHVIRATRAKMLHFRFKNGDLGYMKQVNHPGMKGFGAQTKTERELRRNIKRVRKVFKRAFNKARKLGG